MAESTFALTYNDLVSEVGIFLGHGSAPTGDNLVRVDRMVQAGYHQFLNPPAVAGDVHTWSFLSPAASLQVVAGVENYTLPDDFSSLRRGITYPFTNGSIATVERVGEADIRAYLARHSITGDPVICATRPIAGDGTTGQRHEIVFAPTPSSNLVLTYRYNRRMDRLSATNLYPIGGAEYSQLILDSCLAMAESREDDAEGPRTSAFFRALEAAVMRDRQAMTPDFLGYNGDNSDSFGGGSSRPSYMVTYQGKLPGEF